jgi:large subunit ribosomal protein L4
MQIDIFSPTGSKVKSQDLPESLFGSEVNWGLMHQAVVMQQGNRRQSAAHVKTRGEVAGSTKKLFAQKHTGNARRGPVRSPTLRGGGKAFGPRNTMNPVRDMPRKMRHAALRSALSLQASKKAVLGVENYPDDVKTKTVSELLKKLPVEYGRKILLVTPGAHNALYLSARNIAGVKTVAAAYLNIEDVLNSRHVIFLTDAIVKAEELFGKREREAKTSKASKAVKSEAPVEKKAKKPAAKKAKAPAKKAASKKSSK